MANPTTAQLSALLTAWRDGTMLLDELGPRTDALLAQLGQMKPHAAACQILDTVATDTALMSDAELIAHYKRTSHVEDIRFHLTCTGGAGWRALLEHVTAAGGKATPDSKRRYLALLQADRETRGITDPLRAYHYPDVIAAAQDTAELELAS